MHVQHLGYAYAVVVLLYTRPYTVHSDCTAVSVQYLGTVHLQYRTSVNVIMWCSACERCIYVYDDIDRSTEQFYAYSR